MLIVYIILGALIAILAYIYSLYYFVSMLLLMLSVLDENNEQHGEKG